MGRMDLGIRQGGLVTDCGTCDIDRRFEASDTVGTREYNKRLSDRRAVAVADYLTNKFQIDRNRFQTIGMGKDSLLIATPDQTPEPRNRRVSIVNIGS